MPLWLCRDYDGDYMLFSDKRRPQPRENFIAGVVWDSHDGDRMHVPAGAVRKRNRLKPGGGPVRVRLQGRIFKKGLGVADD